MAEINFGLTAEAVRKLAMRKNEVPQSVYDYIDEQIETAASVDGRMSTVIDLTNVGTKLSDAQILQIIKHYRQRDFDTSEFDVISDSMMINWLEKPW